MKKGKVMGLKDPQVLSSIQMKQVIGGQTYSECGSSNVCSDVSQCRLGDGFGSCKEVYYHYWLIYMRLDVEGQWGSREEIRCLCTYDPSI